MYKIYLHYQCLVITLYILRVFLLPIKVKYTNITLAQVELNSDPLNISKDSGSILVDGINIVGREDPTKGGPNQVPLQRLDIGEAGGYFAPIIWLPKKILILIDTRQGNDLSAP